MLYIDKKENMHVYIIRWHHYCNNCCGDEDDERISDHDHYH